MTRDISEIYLDIIELGAPIDGFTRDWLDLGSFENHTGDYQVISTELLKWMYDAILRIRPSYGKGTYTESLSCDEVFAFNSQWWNTTSAQDDEIDDFLFGDYYRNYFLPFSTTNDYLLDENNVFEKWRGAKNILFYNGNFVFPGGGDATEFVVQRSDQWRLEDLFDLTKFYDPTLIRIETLPELNSWLDELDAGVIKLRDNSAFLQGPDMNDNTRDIQGNMLKFQNSDILQVQTTFSEYSPTTVQQDITIVNLNNGQNESITIYSNDGGEGLPTVDPITGLGFNSNAQAFFNWAVANWTDTYTQDSGNNEFRYDYSFVVTNENGVDYNSEDYEQNFSKTAKSLKTDDIYFYNNLGSEFNTDYSSSVFIYERKVGQNEWDAQHETLVSEQAFEVAKVGEIRNDNQDIINIALVFPTYPAEDLVRYPLDGVPTIYRIAEDLDFSYVTVNNLLAPV